MTCLIHTISGQHKASFQKDDGHHTVRMANSADLDMIALIEQKAFSVREYGSDVLDAGKIKRLMTRGNCVFLVCEGKGNVCGYVLILFRRTSAAARLYSHAVLPQLQGKGVGGLLLSSAEQFCLKHGLNKILLEIRAGNRALRERYLKRGYTITKIIPGYYADGMDAVKLEGDLESIAAGK